MPVVHAGSAWQRGRMTACPPLPLAQQVLAWLVQALGLGEAGYPAVGVSPSTLKNARKGARIPHSWEDLVTGALKAMHVPVDTTTLTTLHEALRAWDACVSAISGGDDLALPDRLHMPFTLAIPALGPRLGALVVFMARRFRGSVDEWMWILRPLDPHFFGHALRTLLKHRRPEWRTREAQIDRLAEFVDRRTVERWMSGKITTPNPVALKAIGDSLGEGAEMLLRLARAICVLREDLQGRRHKPGWLGSSQLDEWTDLVAQVGRHTVEILQHLPVLTIRLSELAAALRGPECEETQRFIQSAWPEPWRTCSDRDRLAEGIARLAVTVLSDDQGSSAAACLALWDQIVAPHPITVASIAKMFQMPTLALLPAIDWPRLVEGDWMIRFFLRHISEHGYLEIGAANEPRTRCQLRPEQQNRARELLAQRRRFTRKPGDDDSENVLRTLLDDVDPRLESHIKANSNPSVDWILRPEVEASLPEDVVRASVTLSFARARRLATAGEIERALEFIALHPIPTATVTVYDRRTRAEALVAITHALLDRSRELVSGAAYLLQFAPEHELIDKALQIAEAHSTFANLGLASLDSDDDAPESIEHLILTLSVELRLAHVRHQLGVEDAWSPLLERIPKLRDALARAPTHGKGWAWMAILDQLRDVRSNARAQAIHFGAQAYLDEIETRFEADCQAFATAPLEPCPDCGGSGVRSDPPNALADDFVLCTCVVIPGHWR